jgi:anti-sigma regulatory factor (Ser/Thr protein kinase)
LTSTRAGHTPGIDETLELSVAATDAAPARARAEIGAWLTRARADELLIEVAQLLASELVTNSVRHAETAADAQMRLTASLETTMLRIELFDTGVDGSVSRRQPKFDDGSGGFGLDLVDILSSAWGVERGPHGTTVWLELPVRGRLPS